MQRRRREDVLGADSHQRGTPVRILIVVDNQIVAELVRLALSHGQFVIRAVREEASAIDAFSNWRPHLAVIDVEVSAGRVLDHLTAALNPTDRVPFIALTKRGDLETKLAAFENGADDIMNVPFWPGELLARIYAIIRRTYQTRIAFSPTIRLGELEVDIVRRHVRVGATELHMTTFEQGLLYLLAANAGRVVTREQILDTLWGVDYASGSNLVDRHVRNLRTKLGCNWKRPRFIATVPGRGYRFLVGSTAQPPSLEEVRDSNLV